MVFTKKENHNYFYEGDGVCRLYQIKSASREADKITECALSSGGEYPHTAAVFIQFIFIKKNLATRVNRGGEKKSRTNFKSSFHCTEKQTKRRVQMQIIRFFADVTKWNNDSVVQAHKNIFKRKKGALKC